MGIVQLRTYEIGSDLYWMNQAFDLAQRAMNEDEVPVGAVLVNERNEQIGSGFNRVRQWHDPTAHAEIVAIREAAISIQNYRLKNTTLYVTLEPCSMCASAMVHARIKRLVFATRDVKAGAAGSVFNLLTGHPLNHQVMIDEGCLQQECALLLSDFFNRRRSSI